MTQKHASREDDANRTGRIGRRGFLSGVGIGAAGVVGGATLAPIEAIAQMIREEAAITATQPNRFGRMFPNLAPFATTDQPTFQRVIDALLDIGHFGGVLDAKDALGRGPVDLITDPALSVNNPNNPNHTAGTTFVGQFLDHDMTFDQVSRLAEPAEPLQSPNTRTPGFDLDSVYGGGPTATPQFYNPSDRAKLRVESGGRFEDVPRMSNGTAIIPDPRNDENIMISGLHAAFLKFHNRVVDIVRAQNPGAGTSAVFAQAQQTVRYHYQWIVLREFLPLFIGQDRVNQILTNGRRFYRPASGQHFIPVEFQGAAYRFGHSMARSRHVVALLTRVEDG